MQRLLAFVAGSVFGGGAIYALVKPSAPATPVSQQQQPPPPPVHAHGMPEFQQPFKRQVDSSINNPADNEFLKFGNPGPVSDFLLRSRYAASYNRALRNPNWVAEHLTQGNLKGSGDRASSEFKEDPALPGPFRAQLKDYYRSGYDRGHMCPAADAKKDTESMNETFLLSNIAPQVGKGFNRNYWASLESFVRDLTRSFDDVYCITGPLYLPEKQADGKWRVSYEVIGSPPNVAVPTHFFKVVLAKRNNEPAVALGAFALPNKEIDNATPLSDFVLPLEAVEKAAGLQFFDKVERKQGAVVPLCSKVKCTLEHDSWKKKK
ncbi:nuclease [Coemansia sp. RSA 1939]|nr:nuclease [Coemansia sp. RSA 1939]KAJ2612019.1 nuclease [Coemansia sp. RSA 1804]